MSLEPRLGMPVHYVSYGTPGGEFEPRCRFAVITEVVDGVTAHIMVFNPQGLFIQLNCPYEYKNGHIPKGGTWHRECGSV